MEKSGFTLLELIVVIIVIGILASIALPIYTKAMENAYDQEAITNLKLIKAAATIYFSEHGEYPEGCASGIFNTCTQQINQMFHLNLPIIWPPHWAYSFVPPPSRDSFYASACRLGPSGFRSWRIESSNGPPYNGEPYSNLGCP